MIRSWETLPDGFETKCDVAIVGSGAGGAAAAAALAEGGLEVVVVEEGGHYQPRDFKPKASEAFRRLYAERGARVMSGSGAVPLPGGRGVGGSTLINSAICFRAPHRVLARWQLEFGIEGLDSSQVDSLYKEVEETLCVQITSPDIGRLHNEVFARGVRKLGMTGGWMPRNAPGCVGCGVCELGCPSGGKNSADRSFLPRALNRGAIVLTGCHVRRLLSRSDRIIGLEGQIHDPETRVDRGIFRVYASRIILAAGSIGTPLLLQSHGLGGPQVGRNLTVHPAGWSGGVFGEVINFWNGVPQGYFAELEPEAGVLLETFSLPPEMMVAQLPGIGEALMAWMPKLKHLALCGGLVEDSASSGTVQAGLFGPDITYHISPQDLQRLRRGVLEVARVYEAAGSHELLIGLNPPVSVPTSAAAEKLLKGRTAPEDFRIYASHPMGTCRMGTDPATSVVGNDGQVHGTRGLYVTDASVFPTPLGVNPQMTVMLMALRTARRMLGAGPRHLDGLADRSQDA